MNRSFIFGTLLVAAASGRAGAQGPTPAPSLSGLWNASVVVGQMQVPFRFGIQANGPEVSGWFYNGDERVVSSHGHESPGHLQLEFDSYGRTLDLSVTADGALDGSYQPRPGSKRLTYPFHAVRAVAASNTAVSAQSVPAIGGQWLVQVAAEKAGEKAWRLIIRQRGPELSAAVLRVDGDTGALTGTWQDGHALLSHFDGARPSVIDVSSGPDRTLLLQVHDPHGGNQTLTAYRVADAQAKGLPEAADPMHHTRVSDPDEPLHFSFPDLRGRVVSNTDSQFRNKAVIVDIAGSWCPNCHDEAPFLESLYKQYHARGLEIVMLSFEEAEELSNPERLRAFVRQFGITYTVLLAGTPDELHAKLPQAVDLDAYPTTFFVGRDGRVKSVHAGFAAAATGSFNAELKKDFTARVEDLLGPGRKAPRNPPAASRP